MHFMNNHISNNLFFPKLEDDSDRYTYAWEQVRAYIGRQHRYLITRKQFEWFYDSLSLGVPYLEIVNQSHLWLGVKITILDMPHIENIFLSV